MENIILKDNVIPLDHGYSNPIQLTKETIEQRKNKILNLMKVQNLDAIVVYSDLEHGSNFEYLTGFLTRFEESVLVLHKNGDCYLLLGNENLNKSQHALIENTPIQVPAFSLPNQPMVNDKQFHQYFEMAKIDKQMTIGLVGWKLFTSSINDNSKTFDLPNFLVNAIEQIVSPDSLVNATGIFIDPGYGARTTNNANEIARFEFWSQLTSVGINSAVNELAIGQSEMEIGAKLNLLGQRNNVVTIAATGDRFENANLYPTEKTVKLGDSLSFTIGYKGGLNSRAGYAVSNEEQLPTAQADYITKLASPYYSTICNWLEFVSIGKTGEDIYQYIEHILPKETFGWHLNPGHLIGDEEWMASPIYPGSKNEIKSGMLLQTDIIPKIDGYAGASCESGILVADADLQAEIKANYPELYQRFMNRRQFAKDTLNLDLPPEILFMNDSVALYKPLFLSSKYLIRS